VSITRLTPFFTFFCGFLDFSNFDAGTNFGTLLLLLLQQHSRVVLVYFPLSLLVEPLFRWIQKLQFIPLGDVL
jgi:hypothetical protein